MKRFLNLIFLISAALLFAVPVSGVASNLVASYPALIVPGLFGMVHGAYTHFKSQLNMPTFGAVQVEIWSDYIANNLFKGVEWLQNCFRADEYVLQGKVVHIPQAGSAPTVVKNRSSLPATAVKRTDTDVTYSLDEYSTDPAIIPDADKVELNYNKIDSVLGDHIGSLSETAADNILINWSASLAGNILRTTNATTYAVTTSGATGSRKGLQAADLKRAKVALDKQKVLARDRFAIMSSDMWAQLEDSLNATSNRDFSRYNDGEKGEIGKLYGFTIVVTPSMPLYDNAATPAVKAYGAAGAATDNESVLCYQKNALELALGEIKFFDDVNNPLYYGDVYSALVRMGGRKRYGTEKGVVSIVAVP